MAEDKLTLWESPAAATPTQLVTALFYGWERRGRGWWIWPAPVELEPPFRPLAVELHDVLAPPLDDARKPTWLSSLAERVKQQLTGGQSLPVASGSPAEIVIEEPMPEYVGDEAAVVEFLIALPPGLAVNREAAEHFLLSFAACHGAVSFEVVGDHHAIIVQLACRKSDSAAVRAQIRAHFPDARITEEQDALWRNWESAGEGTALVVDFGLSHEFMRPIRIFTKLDPDPLIAVGGALNELGPGELGVLQVLFQPCRAPWPAETLRAVTDSEGGSFFADAPEMLSLARAKVARPLFAAVVRVAAKSPGPERALTITRGLAGALMQTADPASNELIPLSPQGYAPDELEAMFLSRLTRRSGMLLNSEELLGLVHPPSASVRADRLRREALKTKAAPTSVVGHKLLLGENVHLGRAVQVSSSPEQRSRHTYVIGASGTGKSTLLLNLIIQDLRAGVGIGVIDPHGDLIDQVLGHIPEERFGDVVLVDPSDADFPIGFNILSAHSDLEKTLLASDLVAVFRRLATSWGDQMTSVLGNAVLAFLESERGGTLADLRRFLVEPHFRRKFLGTVRDPEVAYYWEKEFPLLAGKPQAPLLTRLDTFLRPKLIRFMVAQRENRLNFRAMMDEGKIFLAKLSQGALGEENAHLLGSLFVSKFQQVALSRQELKEGQRQPFYLYLDEFQNFVTPSMAQLLSGARKYGLGLVLAHQDLHQLSSKDPELLGAVLTNPATRICFRVGDLDAQKLESGFASYKAPDLQNLGVGEAICRIERADHDFNLRTLPLPAVETERANARRERLTALSREKYGTPRGVIEAALGSRAATPEESREQEVAQDATATLRPPRQPREDQSQPHSRVDVAIPKENAQAVLGAVPAPLGRGGPQHRYLQELIRRWAESRGYRATIEKEILDGIGSVDVALEKGERQIACEISVGSSPEQELGNMQKCLAAGFECVAAVSSEKQTLNKLKELVSSHIDEASAGRIRFLTPEELFAFIEELDAHAAATDETVRGYKVKVRYQPVGEVAKETKKQAISTVIFRALKRLKSQD